MISEVLAVGSENARTGKELAGLFGCKIRTITKQIERERRAGQPICATSMGKNAGYFLAADEKELGNYCNRIYRRGSELFKTRRALMATLNNIKVKREAAEGAAGCEESK